MQTLNYSEIREQRLVNTMEKVCNDHEPVVITRRDGQPVVMLALDDYEALANQNHGPVQPFL
jgi:antitoxin YefM